MNSLIPGINQPAAGVGSIDSQAPNSRETFTATLKQTLDQITHLQSQADQKVAGLTNGNGADVASTMVAVEQANVAFQLMVEVRNKIVQAYQEISQMPF